MHAEREYTFTVYEFKMYIQSGQSLTGWRLIQLTIGTSEDTNNISTTSYI